MKRAFTLVELLVVIAIIGLLLGLLFPLISGAWSGKEETFQGKVLRKWERNWGENTILMVDVQKSNGQIVVLTNEDSMFQSKHNSISLQANLLPGQFYEFKTCGEANEAYKIFPNIITATPAR